MFGIVSVYVVKQNVCFYLCRYIYMKNWFFVNNNIYVLINVIIICSLGIVLWVDII